MHRARSKSGLGAVVLALALCVAAPAVANANGDGKTSGSTRLSNERTLSRWAHPTERSPIRTRPSRGANVIVSTHMRTEDGFPEVYLALRRRQGPRSQHGNPGATWIKVRIPMRPNGRKGWVRESSLGPLYRVTTHLVVDRSNKHATLFKGGRKIWNAPVGIGKTRTPTPTGNFWIREKFKTGDRGGLYGPFAFGTSDYSVLSDWPGGGVIGIHGTDQPGLIPGRPSHGCVRVRNGDLRRLWGKLPIGTPVSIR